MIKFLTRRLSEAKLISSKLFQSKAPRVLFLSLPLVFTVIFFLSAGFSRGWAALESSSAETLEWAGEFSPASELYETVIATPAGWQKIWQDLFAGRSLPSIDFDRFVVAAVFLGAKRTGGYGVEFGECRMEGETLVIPYRVVTPKGFVIQAFTQPYAMKVFEKRGTSVVLRNEEA